MLAGLIHDDYLGRHLPGPPFESGDRDKPQAVARWTDPAVRIARMDLSVERVRVFGGTAVETGTWSGHLSPYGSGHTFGTLPYTRVWVRGGSGWRLAHEQYR